MTAMPTDVGEGSQDAIFSTDEQCGGVTSTLCPLHAGLSDVGTPPSANPPTEEIALLPLEDLLRGVRLDRQHPALAKGSQSAGQGLGGQGCDGGRGRHGASIEPGTLPHHGDKALQDDGVHCNRLRARHDAGVHLDGGHTLSQESIAHASGEVAQPDDVVLRPAATAAQQLHAPQ